MSNALSTLSNVPLRPFFQQQLSMEEQHATHVVRVIARHGDTLTLLGNDGQSSLKLPGKWRLQPPEEQPIVGDWLVMDQQNQPLRWLERLSHLSRKAAGSGQQTQHMAANIDTLFVVSSCNRDFNPSRLERYLALAFAGNVQPVVLLTKADLVDEPEPFCRQVESLHRGVVAIALDARHPDLHHQLGPWIGPGESVAFLGSSGVGKSTLINALLDQKSMATQAARADDDRGRHTTTARAMFHMKSGAWLLDTPGMRELRLGESNQGLQTLFSDIEALAQACQYRDCDHERTSGCAVLAAVASDTLDARRVRNYLKLQREQTYLTETVWQQRDRHRQFARLVNRVKIDKFGKR
ncbi:GTPase EngC [Magnetococcus marinus MC-1]|uniref:Small ribosomal subunit biogenesis GTPase RsgA n=1 Tax=Magnetococcus marinus (strain ATCC BAA-1437 / JCM 17883 / MC-1) TaxID=156889 RepID=A0L4L3_MAGMM|nr:ribosome small subunit-dependent GTPase A [Magnetococcus marinus]ABK42906.1 GTPase EngC [Magnetococcus marinus MC-1]